MFISKLEKQQINELIMTLQMKVEVLQNDVIFLTGKMKALNAAIVEPIKAPKAQKSEEQKKKQAVYMKAYHARRREEARAAKSAVLETV
jgi:hypothetical protein